MKNKLTIFGNGKMAEAIASALDESYTLEIVGRDRDKLKKFKNIAPGATLYLYSELKSIKQKSIIICVKPYAVQEVFETLEGTADAVYSVAAGVSIESLKKYAKAKAYIRTMPNIGAFYKKSVTSLCGDASMREKAENIFKHIGSVFWLDKEPMIDAATAAAGSSPAFFAMMVEAMIDGVVREGIGRAQAKELVIGAMDSTLALLKHKNPVDIKEDVMSPAGTTAEGIKALEDGALRAVVMDAVEATVKKAKTFR